MNLAPPPAPSRTWLALLVGVLALAALWLAAVLLEPVLITAAVGPSNLEPRPSARGWANSSVWLAAMGTCVAALLVIGYTTRRLTPSRSWVAPATVLALVVAYVFFAQFPATRSAWRIALWSIALPASVVLGASISSRTQK